MTFEATFHGTSPLDVAGFEGGSAPRLVLSQRTYREPPPVSPLIFEGSLHEGWLDTYEVQWPIYYTRAGEPAQVTNMFPQASVVRERLRDVTFQYSMTQAGAAAIVATESSRLQAGALQLESVVNSPYVADSENPMPSSRGHTDERQIWQLRGPHLLLRSTQLSGTGEGEFRAYWTNSTLTLRNSTGNHSLQSRVWDDWSLPGVGAMRHAIWYEIRAEDAIVDYSLTASTPLAPSAALTPKLALEGTEAVAVASNTQFKGTLPSSVEAIGSSVWIRGNMSLAMRARAQTEGEPATFPSYDAEVKGQAEKFAIGGRPQPISPSVVAVGAVGLLALLGLAFVALRELVLHGWGTAWLPGYSKLQRNQVLDQPVRDTIFQAIRAQPGIGFRALGKIVRRPGNGLPIATGALQHHLHHLDRFGLIAARRVGRFKRFFVVEDPEARQRVEAMALNRPATLVIARVLVSQPGLNQAQLFSAVSQQHYITWPGLRYHLLRMRGQGIIHERKDGRKRTYAPTPTLQRLLRDAPATVG